MRSSFFVFFSFLVHCLAVAAVVVMIPQSQSASVGTTIRTGNGAIEVTDTPEGDTVNVPTTTIDQQRAAATQAPLHVAKEHKKITKAKITSQKAVHPATVLPAKQPVMTTPKPEVADQDMVAVAQAPAPKQMMKALETPAPKEAELIPVHEQAPVAVEPSSNEDTQDDAQTEATPDVDTQDPAPVKVTTEPMREVSHETAAAGTGTMAATGHGGTSMGSPRSVNELRQMPGNVPPQYPLQARLQHHQGEVDLLYRVTEDGNVEGIRVLKSSGFSDLDQAAVRAIAKYHFIPGQAGWTRHPVLFALKGQTMELPSRLRSFGAQAD